MSCSICLSDPPNQPVMTVDGSIYCLICITKWFDSGKSTSPTTNLKILKILIPATTLCQSLKIPITIIPEKYNGIEKKINIDSCSCHGINYGPCNNCFQNPCCCPRDLWPPYLGCRLTRR